MFKRFFKKKVKAHDVGLLLYYVIHRALFEDDEALSVNWLLDKLELNQRDLVNSYHVEITLAVMYNAMIVVHNKYKPPINHLIFNGLTESFLEVLKEKGVKEGNINYYLELWEKRMKQYGEAERNTSLWGPGYWVGKNLLENILKDDTNILDLATQFRITTCSYFLTGKLKGFEETLKSIKVVP